MSGDPGISGGRTAHLHRLIYYSVMSFPRQPMPFTAEIQAILEWSRAYNPTVGITGALMAGEDRFAQVLEGPLGAVRALAGHILCDPRHRQLTLLSSEPVESRAFPDWSMAFVSQADQAELPLSTRPPGSDLSQGSVTADGLLALLRYVVQARRAATADAPVD